MNERQTKLSHKNQSKASKATTIVQTAADLIRQNMDNNLMDLARLPLRVVQYAKLDDDGV